MPLNALLPRNQVHQVDIRIDCDITWCKLYSVFLFLFLMIFSYCEFVQDDIGRLLSEAGMIYAEAAKASEAAMRMGRRLQETGQLTIFGLVNN